MFFVKYICSYNFFFQKTSDSCKLTVFRSLNKSRHFVQLSVITVSHFTDFLKEVPFSILKTMKMIQSISKLQCLCSTKCYCETLQNLPNFIHTYENPKLHPLFFISSHCFVYFLHNLTNQHLSHCKLYLNPLISILGIVLDEQFYQTLQNLSYASSLFLFMY